MRGQQNIKINPVQFHEKSKFQNCWLWRSL